MAIVSWFPFVAVALARATAVGVDAGIGSSLGPPAGVLLFGLVGLAARRDPGDALERLTESVERLAAGEYDVDASSDRTDEVGRLCEAVDDLAATLRERERTRAERERQFEAVFADPNLLVGLLDPDGTVRRINETAFEYVDVDRPSVIGEPFPETPWWADTPDEDVREWIDRAATGEYVEYEAPLDGPTGERRWVDGAFRPVADGGGDVVSIVVSARDVTERKERERELERQASLLDSIFQQVPIYIYAKDEEGRHVRTSPPPVAGPFPDDEGGFLGKTDLEIFPEALASETYADDMRVVEEGESIVDKVEYHPEVDEWVLTSKVPWRDADGEIRGLVGVTRLITERKERERALRRYREYTGDVLDAIDDVFYVLDEDGSLQRWNESLSEATGYADAEIEGMDVLAFFPEDERDRIAEAVAEVFESGEGRIESAFSTKAGDRVPYEFVATGLEDLDGNPVLAGIGRDISERVEKERQLETLMDNVPGMVYRCENEPEWPFEFVSDGSRDIAGYDPATLIDGAVNWNEVILDRHDELWAAVQESVRRREPFRVTYPIETADGDRRWIEEQGRGIYDANDDLEALEGVMIDVTESVEYEQELERVRKLLEQSQRLTGVGGWEVDLQSDPPEVTWTDQLYRFHGLSPDEEIDIDRSAELFHPEDRDRVRELNREIAETGGSYDVELRLHERDGKERWVRAIGEAVREDGETVLLRGSVQDITEQKEREMALESLHEATRGLLGTETEEEVADLVAETAAEVLDVSGVAVYLLDTESNALDPVAFTAGFVDRCDGSPSAVDRDSVLWDAFVQGEETVFADPGPFDETTAGGLAVPIGDHGVFVVAAPPPSIDDEVRRLAETLVATTEAALDRLESEAALRERDAELEARNRRLGRQIRITDIIRRIDQSLIGADGREEIETAVCRRLVEAEDVAFAWIGAADVGGEGLTPRAWAGSGERYLDAIELEAGESGADPAVAAARTRSPTVVTNVIEELKGEAWARRALSHDFHSVVSVPLSVDDYFYGVLTIYGTDPDAFGDLEQTVFAELGENVANSIDAAKTRQALHADAAVELALRDGSDAFLARVAREAGVHVEYEGLATYAEGETRLFFTTDGDPARVEAVLADLVSVSEYRFVGESDGRALFEAAVTGEVLASRLVRHGGTPRSIRASETELEVIVDVPPTTEVREFVEMVRERHPSVELVGRRDVQRSARPGERRVSSLISALTDRQREVLRTAYFAGFFEWPRESTGEDVAEMLGVSQPTVNRHLRRSQQRLFEQLFEGERTASDESVRSEP